jgi:hypothetical protein
VWDGWVRRLGERKLVCKLQLPLTEETRPGPPTTTGLRVNKSWRKQGLQGLQWGGRVIGKSGATLPLPAWYRCGLAGLDRSIGALRLLLISRVPSIPGVPATVSQLTLNKRCAFLDGCIG